MSRAQPNHHISSVFKISDSTSDNATIKANHLRFASDSDKPFTSTELASTRSAKWKDTGRLDARCTFQGFWTIVLSKMYNIDNKVNMLFRAKFKPLPARLISLFIYFCVFSCFDFCFNCCILSLKWTLSLGMIPSDLENSIIFYFTSDSATLIG